MAIAGYIHFCSSKEGILCVELGSVCHVDAGFVIRIDCFILSAECWQCNPVARQAVLIPQLDTC